MQNGPFVKTIPVTCNLCSDWRVATWSTTTSQGRHRINWPSALARHILLAFIGDRESKYLLAWRGDFKCTNWMSLYSGLPSTDFHELESFSPFTRYSVAITSSLGGVKNAITGSAAERHYELCTNQRRVWPCYMHFSLTKCTMLDGLLSQKPLKPDGKGSISSVSYTHLTLPTKRIV